MTKKTFIRNAAAAAVLAAIAAAPAWADDVTVTTQVTESIPASDDDTAPDNVTIKGPHYASPSQYTDTAPAAVLLPSGSSISITGTKSVTIENSGYYVKSTKDYLEGAVIAASDDAEAANTSSGVDYSSAVNGGSVDIETGAGGTIQILRKEGLQVAAQQGGIVLANAQDADKDLTLTINGNNAASAVTIIGQVVLAGPRATGLINLTGTSSLSGSITAMGGASIDVNLEGDGSSIKYTGYAINRLCADGQSSAGTPSKIPLNTGAGTELQDQVDVNDGATADVTVNGEWTNNLYMRNYSGASAVTSAELTINGNWSRGAILWGGGLSLTVNLNGVWSTFNDYGIVIHAPGVNDSEAPTSVLFTISAAQAADSSEPAYFHGMLRAEDDATITAFDNGVFVGDAWGGYEASGGTVNVTVNGTWTGNAIAGSDKYLFQDSEADEEDDAGTGAVTVTIGKTGVWTTEGQSVSGDEYEPWYADWYAPRSVATESSPLTVKDDGKWYGSADARYGGTLDITIGEGALWTYATDSLVVDELYCEEMDCARSTKTFTRTDLSGASQLKVQDDGTWIEGVTLTDDGTAGNIVIGKTGTWSHPEVREDDTETDLVLNSLAAVSGGAALTVTNDGVMTGFLTADGAGTAPSSITVSGSGAWDGGVLVTGGATADITIGTGGTFTNTLLSTEETASVTEGTLSVTDLGTWTGNAEVSGSSASLTTAVSGVWNGNLTATDGAAAAFSTLSGGTWTGDASLTGAGTSGTGTIAGTWNGNLVTSDSASAVLTVADGGVWNGNVTADTGSASVTVNGTWNGTVKATEASGSTSTVSLFRVLAAAVPQASAVGVDLTLGSTGNWNVPGDASVRNLTLAGGTVTFPTPEDTASFTGTTVTVTGDYVSDGGTLVMNTVLAGDGSASDKLAVEGSTSGTTKVKIQNVGGAGAQTTDGIEMITVAGDSSGTFETADTVRAGAYVYSLTQNGKNWYLTSLLSPEPIPDTPVTPDTPDITRHAVRPEMGSFATNLYAANTMFAMKLSDRLGETAFSDALKSDKNSGNVWIRTAGGHTRHGMADGENTTRGNWGLVQMGGDLVSWPTSGSHRLHVGLMAGYAHESAKTGSSVVNYQSKGKVSGFSGGLYATWMNSNATGDGPYVDAWLQYQRFKNTVTSSDYDVDETYHSKGFTGSLEAGYTFALKDWQNGAVSNAARLRLEGQVIRMGVRANNVTDSTGTVIEGTGAGNVRTRIGATLFHMFTNDTRGTAVKPYLTLNWIHDTKRFGSEFDGVRNTIDGSRNVGEVKLGVEGKLRKNVNLWGSVGYQGGTDGFRNVEALLGAKILF